MYICPICNSELTKDASQFDTAELWWCFKHQGDPEEWYGITIEKSPERPTVRETLQFSRHNNVIRIIYWNKLGITFITDRFEAPLTTALLFKPDFQDIKSLKAKVKTYLTFS